jgi:hypothetical protein
MGGRMRRILFGSECLSGHAAGGRAADIVDIQLILLVLFGILVDEAVSFGSGLHVVAHDEIVQLS